jgi:hypothetical protein
MVGPMSASLRLPDLVLAKALLPSLLDSARFGVARRVRATPAAPSSAAPTTHSASGPGAAQRLGQVSSVGAAHGRATARWQP